jgi:hypothetical protein
MQWLLMFIINFYRGIICNPRGHIITSYAWGLGSMKNNEAEAYALFEGIRLAQSMRIQTVEQFVETP